MASDDDDVFIVQHANETTSLFFKADIFGDDAEDDDDDDDNHENRNRSIQYSFERKRNQQKMSSELSNNSEAVCQINNMIIDKKQPSQAEVPIAMKLAALKRQRQCCGCSYCDEEDENSQVPSKRQCRRKIHENPIIRHHHQLSSSSPPPPAETAREITTAHQVDRQRQYPAEELEPAAADLELNVGNMKELIVRATTAKDNPLLMAINEGRTEQDLLNLLDILTKGNFDSLRLLLLRHAVDHRQFDLLGRVLRQVNGTSLIRDSHVLEILDKAMAEQDVQMVSELHKYWDSACAADRHCLAWALQYGHRELAIQIIHMRVAMDRRDAESRIDVYRSATYAIEKQDFELLEEVLSLWQYSPVRSDYHSCIYLRRNNCYCTLLQMACELPSTLVVLTLLRMHSESRIFIDYGIDSHNRENFTPLCRAIVNGNENTTILLIEWGASWSISGRLCGMNAAHLAESHRCHKVLAYLMRDFHEEILNSHTQIGDWTPIRLAEGIMANNHGNNQLSAVRREFLLVYALVNQHLASGILKAIPSTLYNAYVQMVKEVDEPIVPELPASPTAKQLLLADPDQLRKIEQSHAVAAAVFQWNGNLSVTLPERLPQFCNWISNILKNVQNRRQAIYQLQVLLLPHLGEAVAEHIMYRPLQSYIDLETEKELVKLANNSYSTAFKKM